MAGFVKMKVRRSEVSQVEDFQQLCLLLEPTLEETVNNVNAKLEAKRQAKEATRLAALEAEQEEDEYDDGPSGSGLDHREECLEEENGESGPGVEQEQSPSNEPTPKASGSETGECKQETSNPPPTNSTLGAPSSSSTTPAMPPPTGSKAELEARREKVRQKLEELKKKKAEETTNSSPPVTSKGDVACPRGPDNIETQPVDITCTSPPVEPPAPEASPPCPAEKKREAYQKRSKGSDEPPPQSNDVSMLPEKSNAGNGDKTTPVAPNDEEKEHFTETDEENENRVPVSREEQLSAESSKGRGRGKGKGRGRGRGKGKGDTRKKDDDDNTSKAATERKPKEPRQNSRKKSAPETTAKSKSNKKAKTIPVTPSGAKDETWDHWDGVDAEWHEHWEEEWGEGPHYGWAGWDNSQVWDKAAWEDGRASLYSLHEEKVPEVKRRVRGKQTEPTGASAKTAKAENGKKPRTNKRSKEVKKTDKVKVAKDSGKETTKTKSKKSKNKVPQVEPQVEVTQVVVGSMVDKRTEDLQKILEDFGRNYFDEVDDGITRADLKEFKQEIKEQTIGAMAFKECKFNPYWKRPAAGVRSITQQKDFAYFYFPVEEASWCLCLAVAFKAAQLMAMFVDELMSSDLKDRHFNGPDDFTISPPILEKKEALKQAGRNAILKLISEFSEQ